MFHAPSPLWFALPSIDGASVTDCFTSASITAIKMLASTIEFTSPDAMAPAGSMSAACGFFADLLDRLGLGATAGGDHPPREGEGEYRIIPLPAG